MAVAYLKCGLFKEAVGLLERINNFYQKQRKDGLPYSTCSIPYQFNTYPSVASTSWYLIISKALKDEAIRTRFCSK